MTSDSGNFAEYSAAAYFGHVYAYSFVGGPDYAYLYDLTGVVFISSYNPTTGYGYHRLN